MAVAVAPSIRLPLKSLSLTPGSCLTLQGLSWAEFEEIQAAYDERAGIRVAYCDGTLELVSPLPAHERPNHVIAYIVTALLDAQDRDWEDFGTSTLKREKKLAGGEPDTEFYIQNAERMRACMRFDLEVDPPPDFAIACDLTSKTTLEAYERLQIPELWIIEDGDLKINLLENGKYHRSAKSLVFPDVDVCVLIPQLLQEAFEIGSSRMLRNLRKRLANA
jgi:Uma2 family endonuclease